MELQNSIHKPYLLSSKIKFEKNNILASKSISDFILETTEAWIENPGRPYVDAGVTTAKKGYQWITTWEQNKQYITTKIVDENGRLVGIYWDVTSLVNKNGESFQAYDWYLDIFVAFDGIVHLLDEDELDLAVKQGFLSNKEAQIARKTANEIVKKLI